MLAISTSTRRGSVAILDGEKLLARADYDGDKGHAELLFSAIDRAMSAAGAARADLSRLACDIGPGSFTGVRVGVSAMQGIALALAIPAHGVVSLSAMAEAARRAGHSRVLAMIDAKKSEVFFALFTTSLATSASHVALSDLDGVKALVTEHDALVVGEIAETIVGWSPVRGYALDLPDAESVAWVAMASPIPPVGVPLTPLYVRAPDAKPSVIT